MKDKIAVSTHLSNAITVADNRAEYDENVKEIIADKQVLAWILKYSVEEFKKYSIERIIKSIDEIEVSKVPVDPGLTNLGKIKKESEEDTVPNEGKIVFDIRFSVYLKGKKRIKFLINIEAQKTTDKTKLKYEIDNRIIYYLSRMISSQKEVEFVNSNYDDIKHVRSIWICMDGEDDSINQIVLKQNTVFGKDIEFNNLDKFMGIIIRIRKKKNVKESKNTLISMLETLLIRNEDEKTKKQELEHKYGMIMSVEMERRFGDMCNFSEAIWDEAMEQGQIKMIYKLIKSGKITFEDGAKELEVSVDILHEEFQKAGYRIHGLV